MRQLVHGFDVMNAHEVNPKSINVVFFHPEFHGFDHEFSKHWSFRGSFVITCGSIGKRYARLDEIGVPFCITIDFDSLEKDDVTIRYRDTAEQKRIKTKELRDELYKLITGE